MHLKLVEGLHAKSVPSRELTIYLQHKVIELLIDLLSKSFGHN